MNGKNKGFSMATVKQETNNGDEEDMTNKDPSIQNKMYDDHIRKLDARIEIMAKINETTIEKYTKIIEIQDERIREYEKKQQAILLDIQRHLDQRSQVYDKTVDDVEGTLENPISLDDDDISGMTGSEFIKHSEKKGAPILVQILNQVRANENHMYALHQRFDSVEPKIHEIYDAQNFEKSIAEMKKKLDDEARIILEKTQRVRDENLMRTQMNRVTQALGNAGILTQQLQIEAPPELPSNSDTGEDTLEEIIAFHTSRVEQCIEEIRYEQAVDVKPSVMTNRQRKTMENENILEKKPLTARHRPY